MPANLLLYTDSLERDLLHLPAEKTMATRNDAAGIEIPLQVGSELRIGNNGEIAIDNPEAELADELTAADAVLVYHFDQPTGQHILRLLDPVAEVGRTTRRLDQNREVSS